MKRIKFIVLFWIAVSLPAWSDTTLMMDRVDNASGKVLDTQRIQIAKNKVRMGIPQQKSWILFDASNKTITHVMDDKKKYMIIDEATINNLMAMQSTAMATAKAQMANLPPAQRAQIEAMMNKMSPQEQPKEEIKIKATGTTKEVAGHKCKSYDILLGNKKISENCVVSRKEFDIPADDYKTLDAMFKFSKDIATKMPQNSDFSASTTAAWEQGDNVPIEAQIWQNGQPAANKMVFNSVKSESISASQFSVPSDYVQQSMPKMH